MEEERTPLRRRSQEAALPKYLGTQQSSTRPAKSWVRKLGRFSDFVLNTDSDDDAPDPSHAQPGTAAFEEWLTRSDEVSAGDLPEQSSARREYCPRKRSGEKVRKMENDLQKNWSDAGTASREQSYDRW
jgi:hypothetical protein